MNDGRGPSPLLGLAAALAVLIAGVASALTYGASTAGVNRPPLVPSTHPSAPTTTTVPRTTATALATTTTLVTTTTVRAAVATPEAAANGLWAAYSSGNRTAATKFATKEVADALFAHPYSGEPGRFQGCRKQQQAVFDCQYTQPSTHYTMTAQADANSSYKIVALTIA